MTPSSPAERLWEIIPGLLTWMTLLGLILGIFFFPTLLMELILLYSIAWLLRVLIITWHLIRGYLRYRREVQTNWLYKLEQDFSDTYRQLYHVAIVPTYKEDLSILRQTVKAIEGSQYPCDRIIVVMAFEQRDQANAERYAQELEKEFGSTFAHFMATFHPADIEGEVRGKGPNITWAGRRVSEYLQARNIKAEDVIVTTLDADNRVNSQYFANVSYAYLRDPDPKHKSFQPLPMFFNNIWKVPVAVKITALSSSYWQMIQAMRPRYSRNFSAHAQSLAALLETDFWSVKTVVEDGHQYWRSYFAFSGNHQVIPIFIPVYMDAVEGETLEDTFRQQYLQRRRWFWGVSDIPFVFVHSWGNKKIPFFYKWLQFVRLLESHYSLATQSFILLAGWIPLMVHHTFRQTVFGYNFPVVYRDILTVTWIGLVVTIAITTLLVPPRPGKYSLYLLTLVKEWILAPIMLTVCSIAFSALPAIDSQTRLMVNKPITVFNVTKKSALPSGVLRVGD